MNLRSTAWVAALLLCSIGAFVLGRVGGRHGAWDASRIAPAPPAVGRVAAAATPKVSERAASAATPEASPANDADTADDAPDGLVDITAIDSYEDLLNAQPELVDESIARLRASAPGKPGLYGLGFAGDAQENVFRNEVAYLPKLLADRFDATGRTVELMNSPYTFTHVPLATRTNLFDTLHGLAAKMDVNDDILLLFITSHGSADHRLLVDMGLLPLDQLAPADIRNALDAAHIRWRVIVISACYSGGFIPALREPHTLIITAARADRTSFGCGSDSQLTWFGKAFLVDALNHTTDFHAAYLEAQHTIAQWETRDHETPSEPQFWEGPLIAAKLAAWRATLPANAPPVPFAPPPTATRNRDTP